MELIKIIQTEDKKLVSARELHQFLQVRSKFADWIKNRINKYSLVQDFDYTALSKNLENGGRELDYAISLDMAKELAMVENNTKGKEARMYFIRCERELQQPAALPAKSPSELILIMAQQNLANEQRIQQLEARAHQIEAKLNTSNADYYTTMGYANLIRKKVSYQQAITYGHQCATLSHKLGFAVDKVPDPRFGWVNCYPRQVLEKVIH